MKSYKYFTLVACFPEATASGVASEMALNNLLEEGWQPVRETALEGAPFPGSQTTGIGYAFACLILLERDDS